MIGARVPAPAVTALCLAAAAADCHSEETRWPWYSGLPPVSWMVARHVRQGKRYVNFTRFEGRSRRDWQDILGAVAREVRRGRMPLSSYTLIRRDARLSPAEIDTIRAWAVSERSRLRYAGPR